jgi:UrcA family protein
MYSSQTEEHIMKTIKYLLPLAALALSGLATAGSRDANVVVVKYGDLNLNSQAGIASLHKRIRNAAESVCTPLETRILGLRGAYEDCIEQAVDSGVAAVGNANLSALHAVKGRKLVVASR